MSIFRLTKKLKLQDTGKKITFLELEIESSNHLAKNESEDRSRRKWTLIIIAIFYGYLKKSFISGSLLTKRRHLLQPPPQQLEVPQMQLLAHHHQLDHQLLHPQLQLQHHLRRVRSNNLIKPVAKEEEVAQVSRIWTSNNLPQNSISAKNWNIC